MSLKIGLIGGLGWPATVAYYDAICRAAGAKGMAGSPEMTIESLDMAKTLALRGTFGDEASWDDFDEVFREAASRLSETGCDFAAIASVTPHNRLAAISKNLTLPIESIVDAVAARIGSGRHANAVVLGTSITMEGALFDEVLAASGITALKLKNNDIAAFGELLNTHFYSGRAVEGRDELVSYIRSTFGDCTDLLVILACTDLTPAFPDKTGQTHFTYDGIHFFDATAAHVEAILKRAAI